MNGVAWTNETDFNLAFTVANDVAWAGTRRNDLGCFYVKRVDGLAFTPPSGGWSLGVTYSDTGVGRRAVSAARLCLPPVAPLSASGPLSVAGISTSRLSGGSGGGVCPASSMVVNKRLPKGTFDRKDLDSKYRVFQSACTRVEVERVDYRKFQVCLSVPADGRGHCKKAMANGTLAGIYFDSAAFGVSQASALTIDDGSIQVATPLCMSPNGRRKQGRVEQCGSVFNGLHLGKRTKLTLNVGLAVVQQANPLSGPGSQLGCFYVTGPPEFTASSLPKGWSMALRYNGRTAKGMDRQDGSERARQIYLLHQGSQALPWEAPRLEGGF